MKTKSTTAISQPAGTLQFTDAHGAIVSIDRGDVRLYAGVRAEQLKALTSLLVEVAQGNAELDDKDVRVLQLLANEFAHEVHDLIELVHQDAAEQNDGGAA